MATNFSDVYDFFNMLVKDYRLDTLRASSEINFETYLQGWLILAIQDFDNCVQDLSARNDTTRTFTETLTDESKTILALLMNKYWLRKEVQDITQMNLLILDRDFKRFSESQNFREKQSAYAMLQEECSQRLVSYGFKHTDFNAWAQGNYGI